MPSGEGETEEGERGQNLTRTDREQRRGHFMSTVLTGTPNSLYCDSPEISYRCHSRTGDVMSITSIPSPYQRVTCPTTAYLVIALLLPVLATGQGTQEVCQWETFKAECPDGHVIVIAKAVYGRMRLGRCVKENLGYLGCQADVKTIVDMKCSGRRQCDVTIPDVDLDKTKPCSELKNYLEVRYECRKVEAIDDTRCRKCDYVRVQNNVGYLANAVTSETGCGSMECPWFISGGPGQHIRVTLLDFSLGQSGDSFSEVCKVYAVIKERYAKKSATICGGQGLDRERQVYVSEGPELEIRILGNSKDQHPDYFMLKYEVFGCPAITVDGATVDQDATKARITCDHVDKTWTMTCNGTHWIGPTDNCTVPERSEPPGELGSEPVFSSTSLIIMAAVAIIICTLVVVIGIVCFKICTQDKDTRRDRQSLEEPPDVCHSPIRPRDFCVSHVPYPPDGRVTLERCVTSPDRCLAPQKVACKTYTFDGGPKNDYEHICDSASGRLEYTT